MVKKGARIAELYTAQGKNISGDVFIDATGTAGGDPKTPPPACDFLVLNMFCLILTPSTNIGIRVMHNSADPTAVVGTTIFATVCGMAAVIAVDRIMYYLSGCQKGQF